MAHSVTERQLVVNDWHASHDGVESRESLLSVYDEQAAELAWQRTLAFLEQHL